MIALRILISILLLTMLVAQPVFGQQNDGSVTAENINLLPTRKPVLEYALAGGFLLAALAIGFKASKRGKDKTSR